MEPNTKGATRRLAARKYVNLFNACAGEAPSPPNCTSGSALQTLDGRVQPCVQGKGLLQSHIEISGRSCGDEYQIPAVRGHRARNRNELVLAQQLVAVALLTGAGDCRPEPVGVGKRCRIDDMHGRGV